MPENTDSTSTRICTAIRERRLLEFDYHGLKRSVAPYCYGISMRDMAVLRAVQVRGASSKGGLGFGKLWTVAKITALRVTDESFVADDPNYNPDDSAMKKILCRVIRK